MTKRKLAALAICLVMLLSMGCAASKDSAPEAPVAYASEPQSEAAMDTGGGSGYALSDEEAPTGANDSAVMQDAGVRKIIYTANMTLTADDPAAALGALIRSCKALGGYVASSFARTDDLGTVYSSATLKVPADSLEELVSKAEEAGKVNSYYLSSGDISLSYYDIKARLENARAEERQLTKILERSESVEEILKVRESIMRVRSDIESYSAQINLWDELVSYATLEVTINRTPRTAVEGERELIRLWKASDVWNKVSHGFQNSARFVVNALGAIAVFLAVALIPAIILFLCIGLPIILHNKNKRRKAAKAAAKTELSNAENTEQRNE